MKDKHVTSRMTALAGGLMTVSGILMAACGSLAIGGILWAAASCLFFCRLPFPAGRESK